MTINGLAAVVVTKLLNIVDQTVFVRLKENTLISVPHKLLKLPWFCNKTKSLFNVPQ